MADSPLPFLHLVQELKHLPRTGWLRTIEAPESVASHSFRLALLGLFAPTGLDKFRCMLIGLCHDLAESVVGDIPTYAGVPKERKHKLELAGFHYIVDLIKPCNNDVASLIMDAWKDYEEGLTPEGRWMREMDKFECLVQAHEYEQSTFGERDLEEFQGLVSKIKSKEGLAWLHALQDARDIHLAQRANKIRLVLVTGNHAVCDEVCELLARAGDINHVCLPRLLGKLSMDPAYRHASLLRYCMDEEIEIPVSLTVGILSKQLLEVQGNAGCTLVSGFPTTLFQIQEFERKVQKPNFILHLLELVPAVTERTGRDEPSASVGASSTLIEASLVEYLRLSGKCYQELSCTEARANTQLVRQKVEEFDWI